MTARRAVGMRQEVQGPLQATTAARQGALPPRNGSRTAVGLSDGPQTLVLADFPTPMQVRVLGPNAGTANRYALNTMRQRVQGVVGTEVKRQGIRPVEPPCVIVLRYVVPDIRERDEDNFGIIAKPVVDGLVRAKILAGDDARRLKRRIEFVKERGARRLEIVLERAAEGEGR